jgi:hypothetical protein
MVDLPCKMFDGGGGRVIQAEIKWALAPRFEVLLPFIRQSRRVS